MRRQIGQPARRTRYGVRTQQLAQALDTYLKCEPDGKRSSRDRANWRAAMSTGFCGLMRAAEFAVQRGGSFDPDQHLTRADVTFFTDDESRRCAAVMMRPCKNGKYLHGKQFKLVLVGGGSLLDPVADLEHLFHVDPVPKAEEATTPLFRVCGSGAPAAMTVDQVRKMLRSLMKALGEDERLFGAHSLRIGGASAALAAGVPPPVIRLCGRWSSELWELYARM